MHKTLLFLFFIFVVSTARGQTPAADSTYNKYLDFNLARFQGESDKIIPLGEALLPDADKLPEKAKTNFYFAIGKMYEDNDQHEKAIPYYEKVAVAAPNYYVVHRALGYLYLEKARKIGEELNAATTDKTLNDQLTIAYTNEAKKALPHLEKAQACDPSDETLAIIKTLYKNIKDEKGLSALNSRLKEMSKNCIDILDDK